MSNRPADVVRLTSQSDLIASVTPLLGFVPVESLVVICLQGRRQRVGLILRYDLADCESPHQVAQSIIVRVARARADLVLAVVFSSDQPVGDDLPHGDLAEALMTTLQERLSDVVLASADRWWSYSCAESCCGGLAGMPIDPAAPGATAVSAALALAGQGMLPDRAAVVESVALTLTPNEATAMRGRIASFATRYAGTRRSVRQAAVLVVLRRLKAQGGDPRGHLDTEDVAELAALCADVVVRDQVLVSALDADSRAALLPVLREVVRVVPPPFDPPLCAMFGWMAYAHGDGIMANVMVERSRGSDPSYPMTELIADALLYQLPPQALQEVLRSAARDLRHRSVAG